MPGSGPIRETSVEAYHERDKTEAQSRLGRHQKELQAPREPRALALVVEDLPS